MSDKERIPAHIRLGYQFGHLHKGWSLRDYLVYPVEHEDGFETCAIHGSQGSGKSSRALQYGAWIKEKELTLKLGRAPTERELWESVLATLCFTPGDFVAALESVEGTERLTLLIWDDILLNFTSSAFKVDIAMYSAVDACFAVVRKKLGVCILTLPNLTRLGKCIKDNVSLECYVGRNQLEQVRRVYRLPGTRAIDSNLFKPILEQPPRWATYTDAKTWMVVPTLNHSTIFGAPMVGVGATRSSGSPRFSSSGLRLNAAGHAQ